MELGSNPAFLSASTDQRLLQAQAAFNQARESTDSDALEDAAREFEAVMIATLLKPVFENVQISEPFGGGSGEKMWQGLLIEEYARGMVDSGGLGLTDDIRSELIRQQEAAQ